jgi:hypothetical protein
LIVRTIIADRFTTRAKTFYRHFDAHNKVGHVAVRFRLEETFIVHRSLESSHWRSFLDEIRETDLDTSCYRIQSGFQIFENGGQRSHCHLSVVID